MEKDTTTNKKFNIGKFFRNIWLGSLVGFFLSLAILLWGVINNSSISLATLLMALSVLIGSLSFALWMIFVIDRILIKRFPKYRHVATIVMGGLVVLFVVLFRIIGLTKVDGNSMQPFIKNGDYLLIDKFLYSLVAFRRGDVIVFHKQNGDSIGRIIGLPGEDVSIKEKKVIVNGQELREDYVNWDQWKKEWDSNFHLIDNYLTLNDMRVIQGVEIKGSDIVGKIFYRYWPLSTAGKINN